MPFILSLFGSNASTKDGIPIVTVLINVSWIGIIGYGILTNKNIILIGALLKSNDENEKIHIINLLFDGKMKEIISKNFL